MRPVPAAVLACALIPSTLALSACEPRTVTDSSRSIYCDVMPDAPKRDDDDEPKKIIAKVRFRCDRPGAETMTLTLRLQQEQGTGNWVDLASLAFSASGDETVSTDEETFRTREVSTDCSEGVFRAVISGTTEARGTTKAYDRAGPRSFEPCRRGLFAEK